MANPTISPIAPTPPRTIASFLCASAGPGRIDADWLDVSCVETLGGGMLLGRIGSGVGIIAGGTNARTVAKAPTLGSSPNEARDASDNATAISAADPHRSSFRNASARSMTAAINPGTPGNATASDGTCVVAAWMSISLEF
jgi:hypothetical protein